MKIFRTEKESGKGKELPIKIVGLAVFAELGCVAVLLADNTIICQQLTLDLFFI